MVEQGVRRYDQGDFCAVDSIDFALNTVINEWGQRGAMRVNG